jgi:serine/threonine-protein phosphatase 2A regulatory subunit A
LRSLYNDKSWRVRYVVAEKFVRLAQAVGKEIINEDLVSAFVHVLKDSEAEVRTAACQSIPGKRLIDCLLAELFVNFDILGFGALIEPAIVLKEIIPCVKELVTDSSPHVRAAVALQISGLAPLLGKEKYVHHNNHQQEKTNFHLAPLITC